jgi:hypothetical protein
MEASFFSNHNSLLLTENETDNSNTDDEQSNRGRDNNQDNNCNDNRSHDVQSNVSEQELSDDYLLEEEYEPGVGTVIVAVENSYGKYFPFYSLRCLSFAQHFCFFLF